MTTAQKVKVNAVIHSATLAAAGAAAASAQIPVADRKVISVIETAMAGALSKIFNRPVVDGTADGFGKSKMLSDIGSTISEIAVSKIPVAGNIVCATTAAAMVEAYGWGCVAKLEMKNNRKR